MFHPMLAIWSSRLCLGRATVWDVGGAGVQKDAGELQLHVVEGTLLCCAVQCWQVAAWGWRDIPLQQPLYLIYHAFLVAYIPPLSLILLI